MVKRKFTLSIGIPVFNEERTIAALLRSILKQDKNNYILKKIYIICDGSTDATESIARSFAKNEERIIVKSFRKNRGKPSRLNYIYDINSSDLILTLDGDIAFKEGDEISKMVAEFYKNKDLTTLVPNQVPLKKINSFISKFIYSNYLIWNDIRINLNNGDNIYNSFGVASILKKKFSKSFKYPERLTNDGGFLYIMSKKLGKFKFIKEIKVYYIAISNLKEMRKFFSRSSDEKFSLANYFEKDIMELYKIPFKYKLYTLTKRLLKDPHLILCSIFLNFYLRIHKYSDALNQQGMWETILSSKNQILNKKKNIILIF